MTLREIFDVAWAVMLSIGAAGAIIIGLSKWLGELWAARIMASVKAKYERELEGYRAALRKIGFEAEVRFSKLHEERARIIADLFSKLVALSTAADNHLVGVIVNKEARNAYEDAYRQFIDAFEPNRIYFSPQLCAMIEGFYNRLLRWHLDKLHSNETRPIPGDVPDAEWREELQRRGTAVVEEIPNLKAALTDEFRSILGVCSEER